MENGLSILIPTWDRPGEVCLRLAEIRDQFGSDQRVHVQVNPGVYGARDLSASISTGSMNAIENPVNVGLVLNVALGLMQLDSEWVWILGDDDSLAPDCAASIHDSLLMANAETFAIHHNQWPSRPIVRPRCQRPQDLVCQSGFGDLLFISATLWRRRYFLGQLDLFVTQAYSCSSQVALLLSGLAHAKGEVIVLNKPLINFQAVHRWSRLEFVRSMPTLLNCIDSAQTRAQLAYLMYPEWLWACGSAWSELRPNGKTIWNWLGVSLGSLSKLLLADPLIIWREIRRLIMVRLKRFNVAGQLLSARSKGWLKRRFNR